MIVDFHAHVFPDAIAEKASRSIADFYCLPVRHDGRVDTLLRLGGEAQVDRHVIHSVATRPRTVAHINDFIAGCVRAHADRFVGFAALHPDTPDIRGEILRAMDLGLAGVKLHPDIQGYPLDGVPALRMIGEIAGKLPLLVHAGDKRYHYSNPSQVAKVLKAFPELTVIAAHFGGWSEWEEASEALVEFPNLLVDCSSSFYALSPEAALALIRRFGADRVLFGSDYPMWTPGEELAYLRALPLCEAERAAILHGNAERLLNL